MADPQNPDNAQPPEAEPDTAQAASGEGDAANQPEQESRKRGVTRLIGRDDHSQYMVRSQVELVAMLRTLQKDAQQLNAYYSEETGDSIGTTVIHVDAKRDMLIMERPGNERDDERVLSASEVLFDTKHNQVTIQFVSRGIKPARLKGEPVYLMPLPTEALRLQRRQAFRAPVSVNLEDPATCTLKDTEGEEHVLPLQDISIGGIGLVDNDCAIELEKLSVVPATLYLQELGTLNLELEIRGVFDSKLTNGKTVRRVGCAFHRLRGNVESMIQRYIHKLEAERRNR